MGRWRLTRKGNYILKLTQYKIKWKEHIQRINDNRLPKNNLKLQT